MPIAEAMTSLSAISAAWLRYPWLAWGVGPLLAVQVGFLLPAAVLELFLRSGLTDKALISYPSDKYAPRQDLISNSRAYIPFRVQLTMCLRHVLGATGCLGGLALALAAQLAGLRATTWWPPTLLSALVQLLALALIGDFGLYWGHRALHEFEVLWKVHALHHSIATPTAFSTLYIHPLDAALQGTIPFIVAAVCVRPTPAILYMYLGLRIFENALDHSGIDSTLVNILTLKALPFRASVAHHDAHHKYSSHPHNAKNYAESFWIWDAMFNTLKAPSKTV